MARAPTNKPEGSEGFRQLMDDESYQKLVALFNSKNIGMVKIDAEYRESSSFTSELSPEEDRGGRLFTVRIIPDP